jgi:hypothetical protein
MAARKALVIGNSAYPGDPLKNSRADAKAVAEKLARLDFDVSCGLDLDWSQFVTHIESFERAIVDAQAAVLFFAGHGIQVEGLNYLIPIGAEITQVAHLQFRAFLLNKILAVLTSHVRSSIIILDACRKNPFTRSLSLSMANTERSLGTTRSGLARVNDPAARGSFIAFAAGPDMPAFDGGRRKHSPFTAALLKNLDTRDVSISDMMINVRNDVIAATSGEQEPWDQNNLRERFSFNPTRKSAENHGPREERVERVTIDPLVIEHTRWKNLENAGANIIDLEDYIVSSPASPFVRDAERLIAAKISACNDADKLYSFVDRYPDSPRRPLADKRLASLEWAKLADYRDVARLRNFILMHDKAPECTAARERYGELVGPTLRESRDLEALQAFVNLVGETRYGRVVQQRLEAVRRMIAEEEEAWSHLRASGDIKELKLFLATYPDSRFVDEAEQQLQARRDERRRIAEARRAELWSRIAEQVIDLKSAAVATFNQFRTKSVASLAALLVSDLLFVTLMAVAPLHGGAIFFAALAALVLAFAMRPVRALTSLELVYAWIACLPALIVGNGQLFSRLGWRMGALSASETGLLFGCFLTVLSGSLLPLSRSARFTGGAFAVFWLGTSFAALNLLGLLFESAQWQGWWENSEVAAVSVWAAFALVTALLLGYFRWRNSAATELASYGFVAATAAVVLGVMLRLTWLPFLILIPAASLYVTFRYRKRVAP